MGASMVAGLIGSVWHSLTLGCAFGVSEGTCSDICGAGVHICEFLLTGDGNAMPDYDNVDYLIQFGTQAGTATRHGFNMTADKFARRRAEDGLRLVSFDPHMSAGAEKADLWVPIRPGSDAAAAMAMANVLVEKGLIDRDYLAERTNAPALVDPATQRVLRRGQQQVAVLGRAAGAAKPYDECEKPALEGEYEVNGVKCRTAFEVFKAHQGHDAGMGRGDHHRARRHPAPGGRGVRRRRHRRDHRDRAGPTAARRPVDIFSGLSPQALHPERVGLPAAEHPHRRHELRGWLRWLRHEMPRLGRQQPTAGFDLGIWEEDGFIECNFAHDRRAQLVLRQDHPRAHYPPGPARLQPARKTAAFLHMAMADPDLYHTTRPRNLFWYACNPIKWWANVEEQVKVCQTWTSSSAWTSI